MQPQEHQSGEPHCVIGPDLPGPARIDTNRLRHRADVSRPDPRARAMNGEVEPRIAEPAANRSDGESSFCVDGGSKDDQTVSCRQWKDHLDTGISGTRYLARGVAAGIQNPTTALELANPRCDRDLASPWIQELQHLRACAMTGVEWVERHVELLKPAAEQGRKESAKGPEGAAPFSPRVEFELRGLLVERPDRGMNPGWIEGRTGEEIHACQEPSRGAAVPEGPSFLVREVMEEAATNACRASNRTLEPGIFVERDTATSQLDPLLGHPVAGTTFGHRVRFLE